MLSKIGTTPKKVPATAAAALAADGHEFAHSSHGSQGGERGNEYQALWMTLACLNGLHIDAAKPQVSEVILEGMHEPYDDIEVKRTDGTYTLLQSKHRDKSGSDNITISELTALPKGGKSNDTAFSLAKYFHGMMTYLQGGGNADNTRFIICVSASFSRSFQAVKGNRKKTKLEANTWTTQGILTALPDDKVDDLFTKVHAQGQAAVTFNQINPANNPQYCRFSDDFINGNNLTASQIILRNLLFTAIKAFITKEATKAWVTADIRDRSEDYIKLFLTNLQFWLHQPKLEALRDISLEAVRRTFVTDVESIHTAFYADMKATSAMDVPSLDMHNVREHLKRARGKVLARQVLTHGRKFQADSFLDFIHEHVQLAGLADFFQGQPNVAVLTAADRDVLKYMVLSTMNALSVGHIGDDACVIDADTAPIFDVHSIHGEIEHDITDLFLDTALRFLIIDRADMYLETAYGQERLRRLSEQTNCKIILLCQTVSQLPMVGALNGTPVQLNFGELAFSKARTEALLGSEVLADKRALLYRSLSFSIPEIVARPSLIETLRNPNALKEFIKTMVAMEPAAVATNSFAVARYKPKPIPVPKPYYDLKELINAFPSHNICVLDVPKHEQKEFQAEVGCDAVGSKNGKHLFFKTRTGECTIYVKRVSSKGKFAVEITKIKHDQNPDSQAEGHDGFLSNIYAAGFLEDTNALTVVDDYRSLLCPQGIEGGHRMLVAADYGSGKTSLLNQIFSSWEAEENKANLHELVIPCHLTQIVHRVHVGQSLVDILISELQRQKLLESPCTQWFRAYLTNLLESNTVLILFDKWDELHKSHYDLMSDWLEKLPANLNYLVASRWHAVPALHKQFHQRLILNVFDWDDIEAYIFDFFDTKVPSLNEANQQTFKGALLHWLGQGENDEVNLILERPLHLALLVEALEPYYDALVAAQDDEVAYEAINADAPWNDSVLYRLKLYQLITYQQLKKYIFEQVGAKTLTATTDINRVNMFTQLHQLKLREIAFSLIFDEKPIVLVNAIDEDFLLQELYNLGILKGSNSDEPEFVYRIFSEYFAAQYLLAGLIRGEGDPIYQFCLGLIRKHANSDKYEQVFRILGEMVRFGEPFLNYGAQGSDANPLESFPNICSDDCLGAYYESLGCYLSGKKSSSLYTVNKSALRSAFEPIDEDDLQRANVIEAYQEKTLATLIKEARSSKGSGIQIARHLFATQRMTDAWLAYFYYKNSSCADHAEEAKLMSNYKRSLENLKQKIETFKWPEAAWGGYWDIDAYLPAVKYMSPTLFLMGAAYFIHRVENRNNVYYDSQLSSGAQSVLHNLALTQLSDEMSLKFFFMMLLTWFKKVGLVSNTRLSNGFMTGLIGKVFELLNSTESMAKNLAAYVLFAALGVFKCRVMFINDSSSYKISITPPGAETPIYFELSQEQQVFLQEYFANAKADLKGQAFSIMDFDLAGVCFNEVEPSVSAAMASAADGREPATASTSMTV